ncbi:transposase [Micromonospora sp. CPCC 205546]
MQPTARRSSRPPGRLTRRHDLTDGQWAALAPLLPAAPRTGRPPKWEKRQLIDGIRRRIRIGAPWRDVPAEHAPWPTVHGLFRRWQRDGTWDKILSALQAAGDAQGRIGWTMSVDSMTSRAHQHAAGARTDGHLQKEPPGGVHDEPADRAPGRSRGGAPTWSWPTMPTPAAATAASPAATRNWQSASTPS